jgi:hypothetical protein
MHIYQHLAVLSFQYVRGVRPSLTLKATVLHADDNHDSVLFNVSYASLFLCCCWLCRPNANCSSLLAARLLGIQM